MMSNNTVTVSVIIPSYNHASFVKEAIESVLMQSYKDFECIIADDCSSDQSQEVIDSLDDVRIRKYFLKENLGAVPILRFLIEKANGKYIALLNSDDVWCSGKLEKQVEFMEANPEYAACFTWADMIDENGKEVDTKKYHFANVFYQRNRKQGEYFKSFFEEGNFLCHPSVLIRRSIYSELGYYNPLFRQVPDFEYWVRLLNHYPIYILQEVLARHRRFVGTSENTSAPTAENAVRNYNELAFIFKNMFMDMKDSIFIEGFQKEFKNPDAHTREELLCERFFTILKSNSLRINKWIAIDFFMNIYKDEKVAECFRNKYNFTFNELYEVTGSCKVDMVDISMEQKVLDRDIIINELNDLHHKKDEMMNDKDRIINDKEVHIQNIERTNRQLKEELGKLQSRGEKLFSKVVQKGKSAYNKLKK